MLLPYYREGIIEAGCDEAGRGCLAGPVYAAAVILPPDYHNDLLNDSKQLSEKKRGQSRSILERHVVLWALGIVDNQEIDQINILNASILAMHRALDQLTVCPQEIIVDGNRFKPYRDIPHTIIVKGDGKYMSIVVVSILAKTHHDECMLALHQQYPQYHWDSNKGYPAPVHRQAIRLHGTTPYHRLTFQLLPPEQMMLDFGTE